MPPAPALPPRPLFVHTQGAKVRVRGERFLVEGPDGEALAEAGVPLVGEVVAFGTIHFTSAALKRCLGRGIPVTLCSSGGALYGRVAGPAAATAGTVRAQCLRGADPAARLVLARAFVQSKLRGQRALLRRSAERVARTEATAAGALTLDALRGAEGAGAAAYFDGFGRLARRAGLPFSGRSRRPPRDAANALLSLAYTRAHATLGALLEHARLHPAVGFLHDDRAGHAALASDMLEEFRPALDAFVLGLGADPVFGPDGFDRSDGGGVWLGPTARAAFARAWSTRLRAPLYHPVLRVRRSLWGCMTHQTALLARHLRGDVALYAPYRYTPDPDR